MSRELEDVTVVNKHRLAIAAALADLRSSVPASAAGPFLRVSDSGEITTNRGEKVREARPAAPAKEK